MTSLWLKPAVFAFSHHHGFRLTFASHKFPTRLRCSSSLNHNSTSLQESIGRIRERIADNGKVEISPSAYDTAWVAMVPEREYSAGGDKPCFPECLDWIIRNQNPNGSWGLDPGHPYLVKDSLSCTLACLLALKKWNFGHEQLLKGLEFIRANSWAATDKDQFSPVGFDVIFPTMINYANQLDLILPFDHDLLDSMILNRDLQIKSERNPNLLGYIAEGIGESFDWNDVVLTKQRSNGSLFNSPATTAAALIHSQGNNKCFQYLQSLLKSFNNFVPTIHPLNVYTRLCMVDTIQTLGIERHFESEIDSILEETYSLWQQKEEEIFADVTCCAVAFRLLRIKGFEASSDELAPYAEQDHVVSLKKNGVRTVFELYRASQIRIYEDETILEAVSNWTTKYLKQQLLSKTIPDKKLHKQVEYELKNSHGVLDRIRNKRSLDLYDVDGYQIMKTAYRCPAVYNKDYLVLSSQDFNSCQALNQKELQQLERWYTDCRLDQLNSRRDVLHISHFLTAAAFGDPQLSDARLSSTKTLVLVTCVDDLFDVHGSREESQKFLQLIQEWKEKPAVEYGSKQVEILFTAVYNTVNDLAEKASLQQGRCVKQFFIGMWVEIVTIFMKELNMWHEGAAITLDEYLSFSWVTIGSRICVLTAIHFIGIKLSEEMVLSSECTDLCIHVSTIDRLFNDVGTFQREKDEDGKLNAISLLKEAGGNKDDGAAIISKITEIVEYHRRKVLRIVYERGTVLPRKCKDVFLNTSKITQYVYSCGDEFTSPQEEIMNDLKSLIYQPLKNLPPVVKS